MKAGLLSILCLRFMVAWIDLCVIDLMAAFNSLFEILVSVLAPSLAKIVLSILCLRFTKTIRRLL